jgi:hypothetical protein
LYTFTPVMPHGDLDEIFPGVLFVTGTSRPNFEGRQWQFSRNMTVVRDGDELTLVNTVRLDDHGLAALDRLGTVRHVVKIGAFHGIDDAFYVDRYKAKLWALPGAQHESGLTTDALLEPGGPLPFAGASLFRFDTAKAPEALLLVDREGGIAIACDSLQNWAEVDRFFDDESAAMMRQYGFIQPTNVGPGWARFCEPQASDFVRLLQLPFDHLLSAHGTPVIGGARERYAPTFKRLYGI